MKKLYFAVLVLFIIFHTAFALSNHAGIRGVQMRSFDVVTVWLGYCATSDSAMLYSPASYTITSPNDPAYAEGVHPKSISRFSKGSRSANGPFDSRPLMDHFMHLRVDTPFQADKRYIVTLAEGMIPKNMPHTIHFRPDFTPNPSFKLNQVGYSNTVKVKHIYLSSYLGDGEPVDLKKFREFEIRDAATHRIVLDGYIRKVAGMDIQGNDELFLLDISELKDTGWFYVWVDGFGRSYTFQNGAQATNKIYDIISHGLYFQRCGTELVQPWAEKWPRPVSHNKVYVPKKNIVHPWELDVDPADSTAGDYYIPEGPRNIMGGHHDAGDYDTRLTHLALSEKLMTLYEGRPDYFYDGQSFIPKAGNGIPDILDEVAWNLIHYEILQDAHGDVRGDYGAVPPGMEARRHPPLFPVSGDGDPLHYYARKATPYTTFCAAAVFAQAARVFQAFDAQEAEMFAERANAAYTWAVKHKNDEWDPENPKVLPWDWEEVYDKGKLKAAWTWAASQLFITTGENKYWNAFTKHSDEATETFQEHKWSAIYPVLFHEHKHSNSRTVKKWREAFIAQAETDFSQAIRNAQHGYFSMCRNKGDWGTANPIANIEVLAKAFLLTGEQKYRDVVGASIDFTLGMNPSEISWMTGAGTVSPMDPLSINGKYDGVEEPHPGIVLFGPGDSWQHEKNVLYPNPENMGFYRRIADVWDYVQGCEYVVDVQHANMLLGTGILLTRPKR